MSGNRRKLVIIGDGETAKLAYDCFCSGQEYEVVGFSAERAFRRQETLFGLPDVDLEEIEIHFPPESHYAFVAVSYTQLNRLRSRLLGVAKQKGYQLCSCISPRAFVSANAEVGVNCFIHENATVQRGAKVGDNVTVWSETVIGHSATVGDNCFFGAGVIFAGFCRAGENCFFGVNCCTADELKIAADCVIGAGAVVLKDTEAGRIYVGNPAKPLPNKRVNGFISGDALI